MTSVTRGRMLETRSHPKIHEIALQDHRSWTEITNDNHLLGPLRVEQDPTRESFVMSANTELETSAIAQAAIAAAKAIVPFTLQEWLTFRLGEEEYGIDILRVQEIRSCEKPTRIANIPAFIKGVVNLRGVIVRSSRNSPSSPQKASRPSQGRH